MRALEVRAWVLGVRARALGVRRPGPLEAQNGSDAMPTEDFACFGRRNVIHYAAFSEGGLRLLATGTVELTGSGLIFDFGGRHIAPTIGPEEWKMEN